MPSDTFATRLKTLRIQAGLTVAQLAARAHLNRTALAHLEAGTRKPSLESARRLALALGVSLAAFDGVKP